MFSQLVFSCTILLTLTLTVLLFPQDGENAHSLAMKNADNADNPLLYHISKYIYIYRMPFIFLF